MQASHLKEINHRGHQVTIDTSDEACEALGWVRGDEIPFPTLGTGVMLGCGIAPREQGHELVAYIRFGGEQGEVLALSRHAIERLFTG